MTAINGGDDTGNRLQAYYRQLTGAALAITILVTWNLWSCERTCPTAPVFGVYSVIGGVWGLFFKVCLIALALLFAFKVRYAAPVLIALLLFAMADDMNRLLPNTYQYLVILCLFALAKKGMESKLLSGLKIMQAGVYLWGGILKVNSNFITVISNWLLVHIHVAISPFIIKTGVALIPFWEIAIGLAFLSGVRVQLATLSAVVMHLLLIMVLFFARWNQAFITYNLFLVAGNFILFPKGASGVLDDVLNPATRLQKLAVWIYIFLPMLNLVKMWPDFMSSSLYSCRSLTADVYVDKRLEAQLPPQVMQFAYNTPQGRCISFAYWMQVETSTVPNPQEIVYNSMFRQLQVKYACSDSVRLQVHY